MFQKFLGFKDILTSPILLLHELNDSVVKKLFMIFNCHQNYVILFLGV